MQNGAASGTAASSAGIRPMKAFELRLPGTSRSLRQRIAVTGNQGTRRSCASDRQPLRAARGRERPYARAALLRRKGSYGHAEGEKGSAGGLTNLRDVETDIYLWALQPSDLERLPKRGWIGYLTSGDAAYALTALQQELTLIQRAAARLRADTSTADFPPHHTRGSGVNPVETEALVNLTLGANDPNGSGHGPLPLHAQVRHFDPDRRRAGLAEDVAALVEKMTPEGITLTLVNTHPFEYRNAIVQGGGYGEHQVVSVVVGGQSFAVDAASLGVRLAPGAGETLTIQLRRYANQPTWRSMATPEIPKIDLEGAVEDRAACAGLQAGFIAENSAAGVVCCDRSGLAQAPHARRRRQELARGIPDVSLGERLSRARLRRRRRRAGIRQVVESRSRRARFGIPDVDGGKWRAASRTTRTPETSPSSRSAADPCITTGERPARGCDVQLRNPASPTVCSARSGSCSDSRPHSTADASSDPYDRPLFYPKSAFIPLARFHCT